MLPLYLNYGGERYVLAAARKLVPAIKLKDSQGQPINRKVMISPTTLQAHPELYRPRNLSGGDLHGHAQSHDEHKQLEALQHKEVHQHADINGTTPLHTLAKSSSRKVRTQVIAHPHAHRVKDYRGQTPLHHAVSTAEPAVERAALQHPQVGRVQDNEGRTPLHLMATRPNRPSLQRNLLQHRDIGHTADGRGNTPLHNLAHSATGKVLRDIVQHPAAKRKRNAAGLTAADIAQQSLARGG
jgi:hypothetical protein